jgi:hypothetical protein
MQLVVRLFVLATALALSLLFAVSRRRRKEGIIFATRRIVQAVDRGFRRFTSLKRAPAQPASSTGASGVSSSIGSLNMTEKFKPKIVFVLGGPGSGKGL